jgi:hypothetical protein
VLVVQVTCVSTPVPLRASFSQFHRTTSDPLHYLHHLHFLSNKELKERVIEVVLVVSVTATQGAGDLHFQTLPNIPSCKPRPFYFDSQQHSAGDLHL